MSDLIDATIEKLKLSVILWITCPDKDVTVPSLLKLPLEGFKL